MSRIVLVAPSSGFLLTDGVLPPLGLMYISSYVEQYGHDVEIIDLSVDEVNLSGIQADFVGFSITTPQYTEAMRLKSMIPNDIKVIAGGPHATCMPNSVDSFDHVIIGEGEEATLKLLSGNTPIHTIRHAYLDDIDILPLPERKHIHKYSMNFFGERATSSMTSRGCSFNCGFCCKTWNRNVRFHSASWVEREAKQIIDLGFHGIFYYDDTFTLRKKRLFDICDRLSKLDVIWRCLVHANTVDMKVAEKMYEGGCREIALGVESASPKILNIINKHITPEMATKAVKIFQNAGIKVKALLIVGLPGETKNTVDETVDWLIRSKPDDFDLTIYTPFPNSPIWDNKSDYDIKFKFDGFDKMFYKGIPEKYNPIVSTSSLSSDEIVKYRDFIDVELRDSLYGDKLFDLRGERKRVFEV